MRNFLRGCKRQHQTADLGSRILLEVTEAIEGQGTKQMRSGKGIAIWEENDRRLKCLRKRWLSEDTIAQSLLADSQTGMS